MFSSIVLRARPFREPLQLGCKAGRSRCYGFMQSSKLGPYWLACILLLIDTRLLIAFMPNYGFIRHVIPAGMYKSQIWATSCLQQGIEMDNSVQKWLLRLLRSMLGVRISTLSWSILLECGIEPIQFNWFRACSRFYNSLSC
eukprot:1149770-Pelagomonas_calceolata.AAC.3